MELEPWGIFAFRLLGNPARFQMLRALKQTPMTSEKWQRTWNFTWAPYPGM